MNAPGKASKMKTRMLAIVVIFLSSCGANSEEIRKEKAQLGLNRLVDAIMSQDPALIRAILSKEQVETVKRRADSAGETFDTTLLLEYSVQRRGLLLNFGEDWLARNRIPVSDVNDIGSGHFAISIELHGSTFSKPVYFAFEEDEFRFAGITRPVAKELHAVTAAHFWWNHWKFRNDTQVSYYRFMCSGANYGNQDWFVIGDVASQTTVNPASCYVYEYWTGAKKTWVRAYHYNPTPNPAFQDERECMYNAIGLDAWVSQADFNRVVCTAP
jgi:hypothetical protein